MRLLLFSGILACSSHTMIWGRGRVRDFYISPPFLLLQLTCFSLFSGVCPELWVIHLLSLLCRGSTGFCLTCARIKRWQHAVAVQCPDDSSTWTTFQPCAMPNVSKSLLPLFFPVLPQLYFAPGFLKSLALQMHSRALALPVSINWISPDFEQLFHPLNHPDNSCLIWSFTEIVWVW